MALERLEDEVSLTGLFVELVKEFIEEKTIQEGCTNLQLTAEARDQLEVLGMESHALCCSSDFYSNLLKNDEGIQIARNVFISSPYPKYPLYKSLALRILDWVKTSCCPFLAKQSLFLLNDHSSREQRRILYETCKRPLQQIKCVLELFGDHESNAGYDSKSVVLTCNNDALIVRLKLHVSELLEILQERGILYVLGIRETVGSITRVPPVSSKLIKSFVMLQNEKSKLTVGARALSKHFHRCNNEWWGDCKGTEMQKNEHALDVLEKIVNDCTWINMHLLPHNCEVIETRCSDGYGARWTIDGSKFRGFLEPQMEDGHAVSWRH